MKDELKPAIAALENDLRDIERKAAETKRAINRLCELAGAPLLYSNIDAESRPSLASLRADQFYGKVMNTAAREYLEMRKAANLGPASPREIFEALRDGGFKFESKVEGNSITALRQVLRKNSSTFHRLDNGVYGLLAWYPNAKPARYEDDDVLVPKKPSAAKQPAAPKVIKPKHGKPDNLAGFAKPTGAESNVSLAPLILAAMRDGEAWTVAGLKEIASTWGIPGLTEEAAGRKIQGTLLSLFKQGLITSAGKGNWSLAQEKAA